MRTRSSISPPSRGPLIAKQLAGLLVAMLVAGIAASAASAYVYTDIIDFNLTETTSTYGTYTISSVGDSSAYYRWVDDPAHSTVISGNSCVDLALFGKADIPAHDTGYFRLFTASPYQCFALRERTATGAGAMYYYDGRIQR
jgi:hypothetical protein